MKLPIRTLCLDAAASLLFLSAGLLPAQTSIQPGQIAAAPRIAAPLPSDAAVSVSRVDPKTTIADPESRHDRLMNRLWVASMFAGVGASGFDAASSWGKREGNPLLGSSDGTFGGKGLGIKVGLAAALIVPQICLRKHKELKGIFTLANFVEAGIFTGVAIHNLQVPSAATAR